MKGTMILAMDRKKQMINKEAESKLANIIFLDYVINLLLIRGGL